MPVLLQMSDTHFGTECPAALEALAALWAQEQPEVLVWSGDITQRARGAEFDAARRFHARLRPRHTVCVPGNHDIPLFNLPARLLDPYRRYHRAFGPPDDVCLSLPDLLVLGVNTTRAWRHKHGEVSAAQVERVAARLRRGTPGQLRVVVVHQPLWVTQPQDRRNLLRGHARALSCWAEAGMQVVLSGHIHLPSIHPIARAGAAPFAAPVWNVQAGTAVSRRVRGHAPNSVNLIRLGQGSATDAVIERWDFDHQAAAFRRVEAHAMAAPLMP
ncbi:MAG: metallophosphoesterase family protein [Aquabacterium sp.]|uniref:metallophosphoesterase family protein n=1 Tax=Aquabacterium sp. TaxID=1872578 RepID=UPI0025CD0070|nr:metallophosphoesterase [uncultured Aquabacterium sp.]